MLYINDVLISTRNKNKDYEFADIVEDYHKTIKEARDYYGEYLNIETSIRPRRDKKTRAYRFPGARGILLVSTVNRDLPDGGNVVEQIRYSPVILKKGDNGDLIHESPNLLVHKGVYSFKINENPDLAYYMLKSGKVGKSPAEGKKFHVYDVKEIHSSNASRRRMEGQILNLIYTTIPEGKLRTLAKSFGVSDVNTKGVESVREELFDKLSEAESIKKTRPGSDIRGFKEFLESSEVKYQDQIAALCSDARERGHLVYNTDERRWEIDYRDKGTPYVLKDLSGDEFGDPMGSLVNFLSSDQDKLKKLEAVMGLITEPVKGVKEDVEVPKEETPKLKLTPEMVLTEHKVPVLKKWLKDIDPSVKLKNTATGQHVKEMLLARIPAEG